MKRRGLLKFLLLEAIALNYLPTNRARASTWSYTGKTGTDFWGELDSEFAVCSSGQAQSPINLVLGKPFAMEAHFVHQNLASDLVVLAVLMSEGAINPALDAIWQKISVADNLARRKVQASDLVINALKLLPKNSDRYYRYSGSLTTPPCSEIVTWLVLKQPISVSKWQIARFRKVIGSNARPIQALNQRSLLEFN